MGRVMRVPGWEEILANKAAEAQLLPFEWGKLDCALFVANAVQAITGKDYAEPLRGKYDDAHGAQEALRSVGAENLEQFLDECTDLERVPVNFAQRGDVLVAEIAGRQALGIRLSRGAAFKAPEGLTIKNASECLAAWRVP